MKSKLALLLISTLLALYGVEVGLGLIDRTPDRIEVARSQGIEFDPRTPLEVVRDLRAQGSEAFALLSPAEFLPAGVALSDGNALPLAGISNVTTVWCNESGDYLVYAADRHGFNNPQSAWAEDVEILLLGDSFAQGACCVSGSDVGSLLRSRGYRVRNLGMGGSGPLLSLAVLREYVEPRAAPRVFWLYFEGNDLLNLKSERQSQVLMRYLEDPEYSQGLRGRQGELDAFMKRYFDEHSQRSSGNEPAAWRQWIVPRVKLTHLRSRLSLLRTNVPEDTVGLLRRVLEQARARVTREGGELVFVYLPAYSRYLSQPASQADRDPLYRDPRYRDPRYRDPLYRDQVLALVRDLGIPMVDFHQALSETDEPKRFFPLGLAGHYNPSGYRLLAEQLEQYVAADAATELR
ncbi:MAG: hypothetical protein AAF560_06620 [Acidobacteriota bacterium]